MENKRGFLLAEETLKIVIALISIGFLVYFLVSLYLTNKESKELELAKASLQHLVDEINSNRGTVEIYNPKSWVIMSWSEGNLPKSCSNLDWDKCLCICKDNLLSDLKANDCDDNGVCLESEFIVKENIKIKPVPLILIIKGNEITRK